MVPAVSFQRKQVKFYKRPVFYKPKASSGVFATRYFGATRLNTIDIHVELLIPLYLLKQTHLRGNNRPVIMIGSIYIVIPL